MDTAIGLSAIVVGLLGLLISAALSLRTAVSVSLKRKLLQITDQKGRLVEIIELDSIDKEDLNNKIDRVLKTLQEAKREAAES